jgi:hypothetical protein
MQLLIASRFVGRYQADVWRYGLAYEARHGFGRSIFDDLTDHVALAGDRADDRGLARWSASLLFFVPMPIAIQPADIGFIYFDLSHQFRKLFILHGRTDALKHIPSRPIITAADLAVNLKSADSFLALAHQIDDLKPSGQWIVRVLEDRLGDDAEAIAVATAAILVLANPVEGPRFERIDLIALAARAAYAVRPTHVAEKGLAGFLIRVIALQLGERDVRLRGQRLSGFNFRVHEENIAIMR